MRKLQLKLAISILLIFISTNIHSENLTNKVIATVNLEPITLDDLKKRLPSNNKSIETDLIDNFEYRQVYEFLILEKLIFQEANKNNIKAKDFEIENYIALISEQNGISKSQLLTQAGKPEEDLKKEIELEILKSKLINKIFQDSFSVSKQEIKNYIDQNPHLQRQGTKIKLRHIFISFEKNDESSSISLAKKIFDAIKAGANFDDFLKHSDAPDAKDGGQLGILSEEELSSEFFDALFMVKTGDISEPVVTSSGVRIFKVEDRLTLKDRNDPKLIESIKHDIKKVKMQDKLKEYFTKDIYSNNVIERFL